MIVSIFSSIFNGVTPALSLIIMQDIINNIQIRSNLNNIIILLLMYLGINISQNIINNTIYYYNSIFTMKFSLKLSEKILLKTTMLSLSDYENSITYDLINRAQNEGGAKLLTYYNNFTSAFKNVLTVISYLIIIVTFKSWIIIIIIMIPLVKYLINKKLNLASFNLVKKRTNDYRKSWYINYLLTYGNFFKELKTFNLFNHFILKYKNYIEKFNMEDLNITKKRTIYFGVLSLLENILDGILFIYIINLGLNDIILIGNVIIYIRTISNTKTSVTEILLNLSNLFKDSLSVDQLFSFFKLKIEDNINKSIIKEIHRIEIINLSYKYPNSDIYSLKNINLKLENKEKIAVIGLNGSGKTTLIKIIMGFYSDYTGEIFINGINLNKIDKESLLTNISVLFQDYVKYEATIRENIAYSNLNLMNNDVELYNILEKFNLKDIAKNDIDGIDTQIGTWFDKGINLSTGQWQKVALSRTFVKKADLYILDEPNSSIDIITEKEFIELYHKLLKDKLGVIITHKVKNIIGLVDKIIVLDKGEIVEEGCHKELILKEGTYSKLYKYSSTQI